MWQLSCRHRQYHTLPAASHPLPADNRRLVQAQAWRFWLSDIALQCAWNFSGADIQLRLPIGKARSFNEVADERASSTLEIGFRLVDKRRSRERGQTAI